MYCTTKHTQSDPPQFVKCYTNGDVFKKDLHAYRIYRSIAVVLNLYDASLISLGVIAYAKAAADFNFAELSHDTVPLRL